jgi:hypothetical protein
MRANTTKALTRRSQEKQVQNNDNMMAIRPAV